MSKATYDEWLEEEVMDTEMHLPVNYDELHHTKRRIVREEYVLGQILDRIHQARAENREIEAIKLTQSEAVRLYVEIRGALPGSLGLSEFLTSLADQDKHNTLLDVRVHLDQERLA